MLKWILVWSQMLGIKMFATVYVYGMYIYCLMKVKPDE